MRTSKRIALAIQQAVSELNIPARGPRGCLENIVRKKRWPEVTARANEIMAAQKRKRRA